MQGKLNKAQKLIDYYIEKEIIMKKIKVLNKIETNYFADSSRASNGGGYSQPEFTFVFDGIEGKFKDQSAGEFGVRYSLDYNGKSWVYDTMSKFRNFSNFDVVEDASIIEAVKEAFGVDITKLGD